MSLPILGVTDLWQISTEADKQTAVWLLDKPMQVRAGDSLFINLSNAAVRTVRISLTPFAAPDPLQSGIGERLRKALAAKHTKPAESALLNRTFLLATHWDTNAVAQDRLLATEIRECREGRAFTMVSEARSRWLRVCWHAGIGRMKAVTSSNPKCHISCRNRPRPTDGD